MSQVPGNSCLLLMVFVRAGESGLLFGPSRKVTASRSDIRLCVNVKQKCYVRYYQNAKWNWFLFSSLFFNPSSFQLPFPWNSTYDFPLWSGKPRVGRWTLQIGYFRVEQDAHFRGMSELSIFSRENLCLTLISFHISQDLKVLWGHPTGKNSFAGLVSRPR